MGCSPTGPTRIICLGNDLAADDAFGLLVGDILQALPMPPHITVDRRGVVGAELLGELRPHEALLFVDAAHLGRIPGSIDVRDLELKPDLRGVAGIHDLGLLEVLSLAVRLLPHRLPPRVTLLSVQPERLGPLGAPLSPPLAAALPEAVDLLLERLGLPDEVRTLGREEAHQRAARSSSRSL